MIRSIFLIAGLAASLFLATESKAQARSQVSDNPSRDRVSDQEHDAVPLEESSLTADKPKLKAPTEEAKQEASSRFQRGLAFYDEGEYALALIEFERAYLLVPDHRVLYNIGQVSIQLSHASRALRALEGYLEEGRDTLSSKRIRAVESDLDMLRARTAHLLVQGTKGAEVVIDDESHGFLPLDSPILIDAGRRRVVVRKEGYRSFSQKITLAGAEQLSIAANLAPIANAAPIPLTSKQASPAPAIISPLQPEENPPYALVSWTAAGVLGGFAIFSGVMGLSAKGRLDELKGQPDPSPADLDKESSAAKSWFLAADILAVSTLLAGGAGLYFTLTGKASRSRPETQARIPSRTSAHFSSSTEVYVGLKAQPAALVLFGRF